MNAIRNAAQVGRKLLAITTILALTFVTMPSAFAEQAQGNGKLSREVIDRVREAGSDDLIPLIIQTTDEPSNQHFARLHGRGGAVKNRYTSIYGYAAQVPASQIDALADDPEIEHVSYDSPVVAAMDVAYPAVKADLAFAASGGLDGQGVGIAIVDTGVQLHPDLARPKDTSQIVEVEIVMHEQGIQDYYGHGTHVAGIINGNGYSSSDRYSFRTFKGLAPGARLFSVRALNIDGSGHTSDIIAGIDWVVANRLLYNIRVMNLSLGHPVYESYTTDPLCRAVRKAVDAGIVVVAAAGNDGRVGSGFGTITSPGNEPSAITVGAMDDGNTVALGDDVLAPYSSKGPSLIDYVVKPDLVAPGTRIISLRTTNSWLDNNYPSLRVKLDAYKNDPGYNDKDGVYYTLSGTSMATPFVSAAAALMIQKEPLLNPATIKARLMVSTVKDNRLVFETGAGYLDVDAALKASGYASSALSPLAMLGSDNNVYIQDTTLIWGWSWNSSLIWGMDKGALYGVTMSLVSDSLLSVLGCSWSGTGGQKAGSGTIIENDQCTPNSLIWGALGSSLSSSTGTVDSLTAVWAGGGNKR
jgi:serine protease AprX